MLELSIDKKNGIIGAMEGDTLYFGVQFYPFKKIEPDTSIRSSRYSQKNFSLKRDFIKDKSFTSYYNIYRNFMNKIEEWYSTNSSDKLSLVEVYIKKYELSYCSDLDRLMYIIDNLSIEEIKTLRKNNLDLLNQNLHSKEGLLLSLKYLEFGLLYEKLNLKEEYLSFSNFLRYKDMICFNHVVNSFLKEKEEKDILKQKAKDTIALIKDFINKEATKAKIKDTLSPTLNYASPEIHYQTPPLSRYLSIAENIITKINIINEKVTQPLDIKTELKSCKNYKDYNDKENDLKEKIYNIEQEQYNQIFKQNQTKFLSPFENDCYKIIIPKEYEECVSLGNKLHNCLGSYEWNHYLKQSYRVAFVVANKRTKRLEACVDIDIKGGELGDIMQALAPCNNRIRKESVKDFINEYYDLLRKDV